MIVGWIVGKKFGDGTRVFAKSGGGNPEWTSDHSQARVLTSLEHAKEFASFVDATFVSEVYRNNTERSDW